MCRVELKMYNNLQVIVECTFQSHYDINIVYEQL
jgi:hypothetical protein